MKADALRKTPTEAQFTAQVIAFARMHGWRVAHFRGVRVQRKGGGTYYETPVQGDGKGFPDLILVRRGTLVAAELKVGRNAVTAEQRDWLAAFGAAGAAVHEWRPEDWPEIERTLGGGT